MERTTNLPTNDAITLFKIAKAESHFDPAADNPVSSADGVFQIINSTWARFKCQGTKKDYKDNIDCALKIYAANGFIDWKASQNNWGA